MTSITTTTTSTINVLVVDDEADVEPMFRQKFRKEIKANKLDFHFVLSANQALTYLEVPKAQTEITLILSDINMPGMNGLELLRIIKDKYPDIIVFMITAYGDEESKEKAIQYGAHRFINKPIDFNQLKQDMFSIANPETAKT